MSDSILVIYGSQTGTAQAEAELFCIQLAKLGALSSTLSCDQILFEDLLKAPIVLFMTATTGQGDPPFNMRRFWNDIFLVLPSQCLATLSTSVFGFGDSSYSKYNYIGKILAKRLEQLGAQCLVPLHLGDDNSENGYLSALRAWKLAVVQALIQIGFLPKSNQSDIESILEAVKDIYSISIASPKQNVMISASSQQTDDLVPSKNGMGEVLQNSRLTADTHFQRIYDMRIENANQLSFKPGDLLYVLYENSEDDIARLSKYLSIPLSSLITIQLKSEFKKCFPYANPLPTMSLYNLIKFHIDFVKPPSLNLLKQLSQYAEDEIYKEKLDTMTFSDYYEYVIKERRSIWEILFDFRIGSISLELIINYCPQIRPREFSIASSFQAEPSQVRLIYGVVEYETQFKR